MKNFSLCLLLVFVCCSVTAQITVPNTTLPDVGDVLQTTRFDYELETSSFKTRGENLSWTYDDFVIMGPAEEQFLDITGTELADSFPQANMIVALAGFQAAAVRDDNTIEVVGLGTLDFMDVEIDGGVNFDDSYTLRKTPISYGDFYEDNFDISLQLAAETIPFLDSIEIPLPGAELDSIRINVVTYKSEEATAWGTLEVLGTSYDVLKVEQVDTSDFIIEAGLNIAGNIIWLNANDFLGDVIPSIPNRITHRFLDENTKTGIIQFTDVSVTDPETGEVTERVTGRLNADILSSAQEVQANSNALRVFPNPSSDVFQIELDSDVKSLQELSVYNLKGERVLQKTKLANRTQISMRDLAEGHYILKIITEEKIYVEQLQVIRN